MTYFGFLALFVGTPILILSLLLWQSKRSGKDLPSNLTGRHWGGITLVHVVIAVLWTTPWDNYLVATNVWWYDTTLVTGITIWWVPIEEYTFFVVQTVLCGLWLVWLARHINLDQGSVPSRARIRVGATIAVGVVWLASIIILLSGWQPGTYLGLELSWMLFPVLIQLIFGADILWHYRKIVVPAVFVPAVYLSIADAIAITSGTWTIDPAQTTGIMLAGILPIEEAIFFTLTSLLVGFGVTLMIAEESQRRADAITEVGRRIFGKQAIAAGVQQSDGLNTGK